MSGARAGAGDHEGRGDGGRGGRGGVVALTFDDGPGPSTGALLDVLARHGVRATFFLVGKNLRGAALGGDVARALELATRAAREGHLLGNHADSHAREPMPAEDLVAEIESVDRAVREVYARAGVAAQARIPFRLPYGPLVREGGVLDERLEAVAAAGRAHRHWTAIFGDWQPETDAADLSARLIAHVRAQWARGLAAVPVLHDAGTRARANGFDRAATVIAVDALCAAVLPEGARFVRLDA